VIDPDSPQIIWRMRIACWIRKATNAHLECVIITAFLLQQWLEEQASVLCTLQSSSTGKTFILYWWSICFKPRRHVGQYPQRHVSL